MTHSTHWRVVKCIQNFSW